MKVENYDKATRLMRLRDTAKTAIINIESEILRGESDGTGSNRDNKRYGFYLSEYSDRSGRPIDLTGLCISIPVLKVALEQTKLKLAEIEKEIETL